MNSFEKGVLLLGVIAVAALVLLLFPDKLTGAAFFSCPANYTATGDYCVEDVCRIKGVKCMVDGNLVKRPDCVCWIYYGRPMCGIEGDEKVSVKSPNCTRRGQVGKVCGAYDAREKMCVSK